MIRPIDQAEVERHFFGLMAELECGHHFKPEDPEHVDWVRQRISLRFAQGATFHAYLLPDGTPIGLIAVLLDQGPGAFRGRLEILDFGFLPGYRGQGYGTELLLHIEHLATEVRAVSLYASTYAREHRVIAFYGRHGLVPVATLPDVHSPGDEGMVYMRKKLA
jgi:GNAT superfamily N-acetyltransferase